VDGKTVLIGTADARIRTALSKVLGQDFHLEFTDDGPCLLEMARSIQPALIILDLFMRKLDGLQLCQVLKDDEETNPIPIIVISTLLAKNHALQAGADAYITYPFQEEELEEILSKVIGLNH